MLACSRPLLVRAEDSTPDANTAKVEAASETPAADSGEVKVDDDAPEEDTEEGSGEGSGEQETAKLSDEEKGAQFVDSAMELQDKLGQLRALLDSKGDAADPALKERLASLETQLSSLGLGNLGAPKNAAPTRELLQFIMGCVTMSMRRVGVKRPSTIGALRRLANEQLTRQDASLMEIYRMSATCITEFTDDELEQYKAGKLTVLPKAFVEKAKTEDGKQNVLKLDDSIWTSMQTVAASIIKEIGEDAPSTPVTNVVGLLGAIPLLALLSFLGKKFYDMQQEKNGKKDKKKKKQMTTLMPGHFVLEDRPSILFYQRYCTVLNCLASCEKIT